MYRDCLNLYGEQFQEKHRFEIKYKVKRKQDDLTSSKDSPDSRDFCSYNKAEISPSICNEFIIIYCENRYGRKGVPERDTMIAMT